MSNTMLDIVSAAVLEALKKGPRRVVITHAGYAVSSKRARLQGVVSDIILIRSDGWTLGAPIEFAETAKSIWPEAWIGFLLRPEKIARSMKEWPIIYGGEV